MPTTGPLEVDLETFAQVHDQAYLVDVREPAEYAGGHVPGAVLMPLGELATRAGELPRDRTLHVICASGNRSLRAASALAAAGLSAVSVAGGTSGWARSGRPVITSLSAT